MTNGWMTLILFLPLIQTLDIEKNTWFTFVPENLWSLLRRLMLDITWTWNHLRTWMKEGYKVVIISRMVVRLHVA